jgi:hypothetical protein
MLSLPARAPVLVALLVVACAVERVMAFVLAPFAVLYCRAEELDDAAPRVTLADEE